MNCKIRSYNYVRAAIFGKKPTIIDRVIGLRSKPHSHTEFQFSGRYNNVSFSATKRDGSNCARFKHISYSHVLERWDTVVVPLTDEQEDAAYAEAEILEGMPYDLLGLLCHLSPLRLWKPSKNKTWCTKTVSKLVYAGNPLFKYFLASIGLIDELRPDQMDMLARYFFNNLKNDKQ